MTISADNIKKRLAELKKEVPRRGFDRHASILKNVFELPIELRSTAAIALAERESIQVIVMFPQQIQRGWDYVPKQALLFTANGVTHLLASIWPNQDPQITSLEGCDLMYMKVKLLLLYGFLDIVAQGESAPVHIGMEFNTVAWHQLWAPLQRLLRATQPEPVLTTGKDVSSPVFERALDELPLKFSNGLQLYGLLPGEELEEVVFQAGTWNRWLYLFRKPASANTMLLLTSHYMVVITEEIYAKQGWIVSYIPRSNVTKMQSQPSGLWNELSVQFQRGDQSVDYKRTLKNEVVDDWCKRWVQHGGGSNSLPEIPV
jgi:hypothetical protein